MDTSVTQTTKTLPPEDEEEDDEWGKLILLLWESIQLHLCLSQNWLMWSYNLPRVLDSIFKFWNPKFHFIGVFIRKKKIYALWLTEHCSNLCIILFNCKLVESIIWFDLGTDTDGYVIPSLETEQETVNDSQVDTSSPEVSVWFLFSILKIDK